MPALTMADSPPRACSSVKKSRRPGHGLRDLEQAPDELRPRRLDQPDLPVEHLGVAHAVVVRLLLELPPRVADERLQRDLVALVRRHRAVVVEEGEEARAGGARAVRARAGHGAHGRVRAACRRVASHQATVCSARRRASPPAGRARSAPAASGRIGIPARGSRKRVT